MEEERNGVLIFASGKKKIGKTHVTCGMIQDYITPIPSKGPGDPGKKARKVLIYDTQLGEYSNERIIKMGFRFRTKVLAIKDLYRWVMQSKIEVRRILPMDDTGRVLTDTESVKMLGVILKTFKGGLLVIEDINKLLTNDNKDLTGVMISTRHLEMDLISHLQSLSGITQRMYQNTSYFRFHYMMDDIERFKDRIPSFDMFKIAQILVNTEYHKGNQRFYLWIDREDEKIRGEFNLSQYKRACEEYVITHRSIVRPYLDRYKGQQDANIKATKDAADSFIKYYGN